MTDQPKPCRSTQHCAVHDFCHRCTPSLDGAVRHLVKAISAAGITTGSGDVYAQLAATVRDAARTAARQTTGQDDTKPMPCQHCGREVEDRGDPSMDGNHRVLWVHVPGGYTLCNPQQAAHSTRAHPAVGQPAEAHDTARAALRERLRLAIAQQYLDDTGSGRTIHELDDTEFGSLADAALSVLTVEDER